MSPLSGDGSEHQAGRASDWIRWHNLRLLLPVALAYFLLAKLSLSFAFLQSNASPIWPPTGLAIAVTWIYGKRILPAIFAGSLLTNLTVGPATAAPVMALGNSLEALAAYTLLRHQVHGRLFATLSSTASYIFGASLLAPVVSASIGVGSLMAAGVIAPESAPPVWLTWWTGDVVGALVIGPLLIGARQRWEDHQLRWDTPSVMIIAGAALCASLIFCNIGPFHFRGVPVAFLLLPVFVYVATRLCLPCSMLCLLVCSAIAVHGTMLGYGPFALQPPNTALGLLQAFIGISCATILIMHASMVERQESLSELRKTAEALARNIVSQQMATQEREQALKQLLHSEKLAALGGLVAGIAHELNTPLGNNLTLSSSISNMVEQSQASLRTGQLSKSGLNDTFAALNEASLLLEKNCRRASELIGHFKQVAVDQTSMRRREFDLRQAIDDILAALRPQLKRTTITITTGIPQGISMESYPGALDHILTNLVNNSLLHAFAEKENGEISLLCEEHGDSLTLIYADNGAGIPQDIQERVFDPFFTTRLGQGGSGLGLYLVYNMVTGPLGGQINLESTPGQGCRFRIDMPRRAPDQQET